jgi:hypothetical protein
VNEGIAHPVRAKRRHKVASQVENAARVIGPLEPGMDVIGITNGQFSMIDIIDHCLEQAGPSHVCVTTWTTGIYDIERMEAFARNARLLSLSMIVDPTVFGKSPEFSAPMVKAFGEGCFRMGHNHAKVTVLHGGAFPVAIRSSMNLNRNKRPENFDLSTCADVVAFYHDWFKAFWDAADNGQGKQDIISGIFRRFKDTAARESALPSVKDFAARLPSIKSVGTL